MSLNPCDDSTFTAIPPSFTAESHPIIAAHLFGIGIGLDLDGAARSCLDDQITDLAAIGGRGSLHASQPEAA